MIRSQTGLMGTDSYKIKFLYNVLSALSLSVFPSPSLGGLLHIIQTLSYHLGFTLVDHSNPYLSTCPIRHPYQFFVSCSDQGSTFRGLLFINAARRVVVVHLMWWWQPLLRYFGFPFFLRIWRVDYSSWDAPLIRILQCPRRNYSSDMFSLPHWA